MIQSIPEQNRAVALEPEGRGRGRISEITGRFVFRFLAMLALMYVVYGNVHILFFRNESGWMVMDVQRGIHAMLQRAQFAFTTARGGHYIPVMYCFELVCAAVCRTSEAWWRFRQMVLLALMALAMMSLFGRMAVHVSPHRSARFWIKAGLSALFVFTPVLIDFVNWPFTSGQFIWAALTLLSLSWIGKAIVEAQHRDLPIRPLVVSLVCGYVTMHFFGLGLCTMVGWCSVMAVLVLEASQRKAPAEYLRNISLVAIAGVLLTAFHLSLMVLLISKMPPNPHPITNLWQFALQTLGFVACFFYAAARSLWSPDAWAFPRTDLLAQEWPYGLGIILLLTGCAVRWYCAFRVNPSPAALSRLCWHVFSLAAFAMFTLMVCHRLRLGDGTWLNFLLGPRYIWPGAFLLIGFVLSFVLCLRSRDPWLASILGVVLVAGSAAGTLVYQRQVVPVVWPFAVLSHEVAWKQLVAMTRELHQAGLPLPNLSLERMCWDFHTPLKEYKPGLRVQGGFPLVERFEWLEVSQITPAMWRDMKNKSPTLVALSRTVFVDVDASLPPPPVVPDRAPISATQTLLLTSDVALQNGTLERVKDHPNLGVDITINGVTRKSIWIDPPTSLTFRNVVLGDHPNFHAFVAIHPAVYGEVAADGAVFQVDVIVEGRSQRIAEVDIDPFAHPEQKTWNALNVDLSKYAGKRIDLAISNSSGPRNNDYADWCVWGDPQMSNK